MKRNLSKEIEKIAEYLGCNKEELKSVMLPLFSKTLDDVIGEGTVADIPEYILKKLGDSASDFNDGATYQKEKMRARKKSILSDKEGELGK